MMRSKEDSFKLLIEPNPSIDVNIKKSIDVFPFLYTESKIKYPELSKLVDIIIKEIDNSDFRDGYWFNNTWETVHFADGLSNSCRTICSLILDQRGIYRFANSYIGTRLLHKYLPLIIEHSKSTLVYQYDNFPKWCSDPTKIYSVNMDRFYTSDSDITQEYIRSVVHNDELYGEECW